MVAPIPSSGTSKNITENNRSQVALVAEITKSKIANLTTSEVEFSEYDFFNFLRFRLVFH